MTQVCKVCLVEKDDSKFRRNRNYGCTLYVTCRACCSLTDKKRHASNPEKRREIVKKSRAKHVITRQQTERRWREKNKEKCMEYGRNNRATNTERNKERMRKWRIANPLKIYEWHRKWSLANSAKCAGHTRTRDARKLNATPSWANKFFIEEAYQLAALRTKMLGFPWHVDHIVPLQGRNVCGLHVENNLQVIPAIENLRKHNRHCGE